MNKSKKTYATSSMPEGNSNIRKVLLCSLSKLSLASTLQTGHNELKSLIPQLNLQQISILISLLSDPQDLQRAAKKEYLKVFSLLSEFKGPELAEYLGKIIQVINKRIIEGDMAIHQTIAETVGSLNECCIQKSGHVIQLLSHIIQVLQGNFQHNNKPAQQVSSMCLTKIIQTTQLEVLQEIMKQYTLKTIDILRTQACKSQCGLLESLLSLLLTVEQGFASMCQETIAITLECLQAEEWAARKVSIDLIYTLAVLLPKQIIEFTDILLQHLSDARKDKIKYVREAAQIAITALKDLHNEQKDNKQISTKQTQKHSYGPKATPKPRSIFQTSANEEFFKFAPKNDVEIKENLPKNNSLYSPDDHTDELIYSAYNPYPDRQFETKEFNPTLQESQTKNIPQNTPPKTLNKSESVSPLVTKYFINRPTNTFSQPDLYISPELQVSQHPSFLYQREPSISNLTKAKLFTQEEIEKVIEDKILKLQGDFQREFYSVNKRIQRVEQMVEYIYQGLVKKNIIESQDFGERITNPKQGIQQAAQQDNKLYSTSQPELKTAKFTFDKEDPQEVLYQQYQSQLMASRKQDDFGLTINFHTLDVQSIEFRKSNHSQNGSVHKSFNGSAQKQSPFKDIKVSPTKFDGYIESNIQLKIHQSLKVYLKHISQYLQEKNYKEAFGLALTQPEDSILINTLNKTDILGPCCQQLDPLQVEFLINKLRVMLINDQNVSMALQWILDALIHQKNIFSDILAHKILDITAKLNNLELAIKITKLLKDKLEQ